MPSSIPTQEQKRFVVGKHVRPSNVKGLTQILTTLLPLAALWYAAVVGARFSYWITFAITLVMTLFLLRAFALMHDCGHGSLFRSPRLNRGFGFILGVVSGMPQYVWAQHHHYHHKTNGNWAKYRGALDIRSVGEYDAMSAKQQFRYEHIRSVWMAPLAGFVYLIFNPRRTWVKGSIGYLSHIVRGKIAQPNISIRAHASTFEARYWNSPREYRHMLWNNVVLLSTVALLAWSVGPFLFFPIYVVSLSLAGGAGLVLFTVQHNFEHSYAGDDFDWDSHDAAIHGTSYLILPAWLNWFTLDISYHHVHHLSARIPNYRLADCHQEYEHLFGEVPRIKLVDIGKALKFILWDPCSRRIVSIAEHRMDVLATANGCPAPAALR